jgi:hypothetical protein
MCGSIGKVPPGSILTRQKGKHSLGNKMGGNLTAAILLSFVPSPSRTVHHPPSARLGWCRKVLTLRLNIMSERIYFGSIKKASNPKSSRFRQRFIVAFSKDVPYSKRKNRGLQAVFKEVSRSSYDEAVLDFSHYDIGGRSWPLWKRSVKRPVQRHYMSFQLREEKAPRRRFTWAKSRS